MIILTIAIIIIVIIIIEIRIIVIRIIAIIIIIVVIIIIEIRMEILQGASLRMGSLHQIKVIGSDIEGRTYNKNTICDCILIIRSTPGLPRRLRHGESIASLTCQGLGKPTLTSAQAKRSDAFGIKF